MDDIKKLRNSDIVKTLGFSDEYKGGEAEYIVVSPSDECDFLSENKEFGFKRADDCKDKKCPHLGECKIVPTHEVTPNGFDIIQDKDNAFVCHVLQYHDPMKEFEALAESFNMCAARHAALSLRDGAEAYESAAKDLRGAIEKWRKRHTEQNRPLSIDLGEPLPEMLNKQCGFGEEE